MMGNNASTKRDIREGLVLCMLLTALIDGEVRPEEREEIARMLQTGQEFTSEDGDAIDKLLLKARNDIAENPEGIMETIARCLPDQDSRRRGVEVALRVMTSDGIVSPDAVALLRNLVTHLELPPETIQELAIVAQPRLIRFMMIYLVYLTATADGELHPSEFEEMIPFVLSLPAFKGVSTNQFAFISHSVRSHFQDMKGEWGLDYITGTLRRAAELLNDPTLPEQALRLVARGLFADGVVKGEEKEFFLSVASKLKVSKGRGEEIAQQGVVGIRG
ncbi:MAG: TerB family tellurite resistance protein [Candidatus Sumerlaeia bacterium]|nr:TerB family tellurite resistance protein [Candidatus Sumerlaeia bacterium]